MKKLLPFAVILLLLSGCASKTSIDDQVKLLEYEKCLDIETSWFLQQFVTNPSAYGIYQKILDEKKGLVFDWMIANCKAYKP